MEECVYKDGELILKQGETGNYVLQIASGEVEVFIDQGGEPVVLGSVNPGGFLGEMGVIEGHTTHGASARARGDVAARLLDREEFLRLVSADDETAYGLIERMSARLRATSLRLASSVTPAQPNRQTEISIHSDAVLSRPQIPSDGLRIDSLPFSVGRHSRRADSGAGTPDLVVEDSRPFRLSRRHFSITRSGEDVVVYDLESTLGTEVNGEVIGKHFGKDYETLHEGQNTIVAGGHASPFVFRVDLG